MRKVLFSLFGFYSFLFATSPFEKIEHAYRDGLISFDEFYLYRTYAIFDPDRLPVWLRVDDYSPFCATPVIMDIKKNLHNLAPRVRSIVERYLTRPSLDQQYNSPSGHFKIHYTMTGENAVPNFDYVLRFANYFDVAWRVMVDTIGYYPPPSDGTAGGDSRYDVYIIRIAARTYGYTQTESIVPDTAWNMATSYIIVRNEYEGFYSPEAGAMRTTAAHEFHHAIIFGYNYNTPSWWQEPCCVNMEDRVASDVNDCYQYLPAFFENPEAPLMFTNGSHEYGAFVLPRYFQERFGDGLLRDFYYRQAYVNDVLFALENVLSARSTSFINELVRFYSWCYVTGSRNDRRHFKEAAYYPEIYLIGSHSSYPVSETGSSYPPYPLGANFVRLVNDYSGGSLSVELRTCSSCSLRVGVVKKLGGLYFEEGATYFTNVFTLNIADWSRYSELGVVVVNPSRTGDAVPVSYGVSTSGTACFPPRNLTATYWQDGYIPLRWDVPGAGSPSSYNILRSDTSGGPYNLIGVSTTTSYVDNTVLNGRIYYYVVEAMDYSCSGGRSGYSNQAAAIAGPGGGSIDTVLVDNGIEQYYYGGSAGIRLANVFTPSALPARIVALQFNLHDPGAYSVEIRKCSGGSIGDIVWTGSGIASSAGWSRVEVADEVVVFGSALFNPESSFAVVFKPSRSDQNIWASPNNSGRSFYWNGSTWVSLPITFMIRAIVERISYLAISEPVRSESSFVIYPNPFNSFFVVRFPFDNMEVSIEIFDIFGVKRTGDVLFESSERGIKIEPVRLSSGLYFLRLLAGSSVYRAKVVYIK